MSSGVDLKNYAQLGLTLEYFDQLFNRKISFGKQVFSQWLKPGAGSSYKCGFLSLYTCYNAGWVNLSPKDVRFGQSGKGNHSGSNDGIKYFNGSITSYATIDNGNGGKTDILAREWGSGDNTEDPKKNKATIQQLIYAAKNSIDSPIVLYNAVRSSSHRYVNNSHSLKLDYSKANANNISIKPIKGTLKRTTTNTTISPGDYTQNANGGQLTIEFKFRPKNNPPIKRSYVSASTIELTLQNGWNEEKTEGKDETHEVTDTVRESIANETSIKVKAGVDEANGFEGENKTTFTKDTEKNITNAVTTSWSKLKGIDFSETQSTSILNQVTSEIEFGLDNLLDNGDGTYGGVPDVSTSNPGDIVTEDVTKFIPGQDYKVVLLQTSSTVDHILEGDFWISGSAGSLKDQYGDNADVSLNAASALARAKSHFAASIYGDTPGLIDPDNTYKPGDDKIRFRGKIKASQGISTDFTLRVLNATSPSNALVSDLSDNNLGLYSPDSDSINYDMGLVGKEIIKAGNGYALTLETKAGQTSTIKGEKEGKSIIHASYEGNHKFIDHKETVLFGNENNDTFTFNKKWAFNNQIHANGGNDVIKTKRSQVASLGEGDDTYVINGNNSSHNITLGEGMDWVVINKAKGNYFTIKDFSYLDDVILTNKLRDSDKLSAKLVMPSGGDDLAGAFLKFKYDGVAIGEAQINHDKNANDVLTDIDRYLEIALLNADKFDITPLQKYWKDGTIMSPSEIYKSLVVNSEGFKNFIYSFDNWKEADNMERSQVLSYNLSYASGEDVNAKPILRGLNKLPDELTSEFSIDLIQSLGIEWA